MYYVTAGPVIYSAHYSAKAAAEAKIRHERRFPERVFGVHRIAGKWEPGDNPAPRYYREVLA